MFNKVYKKVVFLVKEFVHYNLINTKFITTLNCAHLNIINLIYALLTYCISIIILKSFSIDQPVSCVPLYLSQFLKNLSKEKKKKASLDILVLFKLHAQFVSSSGYKFQIFCIKLLHAQSGVINMEFLFFVCFLQST